MAKPKRHFYLVDNLNGHRAEMIRKGLKAVSTISGVTVDVGQGVIEVVSTVKPDTHVQMACDLAGTIIRTKLKKRQLH